jgi:hypothetical protein
MEPTRFQRYGHFEPAGLDKIEKVGLVWRGDPVGDPTITDPTTGTTVTVAEAVCRTPRGKTETTCTGGQSCWKCVSKHRDMAPCEGCDRVGVVFKAEKLFCKFCHEKKFAEIGTLGPWLALTAASN